jgi:hypothetical protein
MATKMRVTKRVRSTPPSIGKKPGRAAEMLKECASDIEFRIPTLEHKISVLRNNAHVMPEVQKMADAMEWEKGILTGRLVRIQEILAGAT